MNKKQELNQIAITSPDGREARLIELRRLFPDLFDGEGALDEKALRQLITEEVGHVTERFRFEWAGKTQSKRFAFAPSKATLVYDPERSVNADGTENKIGETLADNTSQNLIIEGDNLEVLKLLQASFFEKVKCIYIDPPYNTGSDFIYPDDFTETVKDYWESNGTLKEGARLVALPETSGRRHSAWLSMIYPRMLLARNLLRSDGALLISLDDNEIHNMRRLMDEVFGEENFVNCVAVKMSEASGVKMAHVKKRLPKLKEYILIYRKSSDFTLNPIKERSDTWNEEYQYFLADFDISQSLKLKEILEVEDPKNSDIEKADDILKSAKIISAKQAFSESGDDDFEAWRWENAWRIIQAVGSSSVRKLALKSGKDDSQDIRALKSPRGLIYLYKTGFNKETKSPRIQIAFADDNLEQTRGDFWADIKTTGGIGQEGGIIFPNGKKPQKLLRRIVEACTSNNTDDVVMDFFAGSGSMGQAVIEQNIEDGGRRNFVLVQVPEIIDAADELYELGFKTISQVCIERVKNIDPKSAISGFRVLSLTNSYFPHNTFHPDPDKTEEENIKALETHLKAAAQLRLFEEDEFNNVVTEIALKNGFGLFYTLERLEDFTANAVYRLAGNDKDAILCLDAQLDGGTIEALKEHSDDQLIVLKAALDTTKKFELQTAFADNLWVV